MKARYIVAMLLVLCPRLSSAQKDGVVGYWREPGGSAIRIEPCGPELCARLVAISPTAPARMDARNPDQTLRTRPLCGLEIGRGFHLSAPDRAEGGKLYDPKSGRTYSGSMTVKDGALHLRGYLGLSVFGRTEIWSRLPTAPPACKA